MARSENSEFTARSSTGSTFASVAGFGNVSQTFGGSIMNSISTKTVRDLAVEIPGATRVFESLGIDYCCGGDRTLGDACDIAGVTIESAMTSLEQVSGSHAQFEEP